MGAMREPSFPVLVARGAAGSIGHVTSDPVDYPPASSHTWWA